MIIIHCFAVKCGKCTQKASHYRTDAYGDKADLQGDPGSVDQTAEDITPQVICAKGMGKTGILIGNLIVLLVIVIGRNNWRKNGYDKQHQQDSQPHHSGFVPVQPNPSFFALGTTAAAHHLFGCHAAFPAFPADFFFRLLCP